MSRPDVDAREALRLLDQVRDLLLLLVAVEAELDRDPHASANAIHKRLRADGLHRRKGVVLAAVVAVRKARGYPASRRGPGRPRKPRDRFSEGQERAS